MGDGERLCQELHGGVCQQVTAVLLRCQALDRRVERGGAASSVDFEALSSVLAESPDEAHKVALGLCFLEPDPEALAPALRALTSYLPAQNWHSALPDRSATSLLL
jgi:signal transduction histidine kinase